MMRGKQKKIAVLHHLGGGNLGDEASLKAVIQNILKRWPDAEIHAFTMNPEDTSARCGIPAFPIRSHTWSTGYSSAGGGKGHPGKKGFGARIPAKLRRILRSPLAILREIRFLIHGFWTIRQYDQLVVSGGGQLTGRSGPWGFPLGIFLWISLARLAGVRRVILSIGAGPLNHPLVNFFSIQSLNAANYVSFRDGRSAALVRKHGYKGPGVVLSDNAYLLELPRSVRPEAIRDCPVVGISPMPYPFCDPQEVPSRHREIYEDCMGKFAKFSARVKESGFAIELFAGDVGADPMAIEDVRKLLKDGHRIDLPPYRPDRSLDELLGRMAALDYVVTCRFHGVVLAHILNKPMLGLAHHPKVTTAMTDLGLSEYCFDIANFDADRLFDAFNALVNNSQEIRRKMEAQLAAYRAELNAQFDELYAPVMAAVREPAPC